MISSVLAFLGRMFQDQYSTEILVRTVQGRSGTELSGSTVSVMTFLDRIFQVKCSTDLSGSNVSGSVL